MKDAIKFLKSTRTGIAVGTAIRLKDLMDEGSNPHYISKVDSSLMIYRCSFNREVRKDSCRLFVY